MPSRPCRMKKERNRWRSSRGWEPDSLQPTRLSRQSAPESLVGLQSLVMVAVVVPIVVIVAPGPIFLLLVGRQFAKIPMRVPVRFHRPLLVIHDFIVVPLVIVGIVRIVGAVIMMFAASESGHRRS